MTREERLRYLADEIASTTKEIKELEGQKNSNKQEFFDLVEDEFRGRDYLLPIRTVDVPDVFFDKTDMGYEEFCDTRFPGWDIEHIEKNIAEHKTTFVMKKSPKLMGQAVTTDTVVVTKSVVEYGPEIDWETLKKERPDLWDAISKDVTHQIVDEERFTEALTEEPELLSILERHMKVREPSVKILSKVVKKNDDDEG